jgi:hypothetical protein
MPNIGRLARLRSRARTPLLPCAAFALLACGNVGPKPAPAPACDSLCEDSIGLRALRETIKLVYNLTLQGNPVGAQDETTDCPESGNARVFGNATSDATVGATQLQLGYTFTACTYQRVNATPEENYRMTLSGSLTENGVLAVQPTATTALEIRSDDFSLDGTVYDPPHDYAQDHCVLNLFQDGNTFSGTLCGKAVGVSL